MWRRGGWQNGSMAPSSFSRITSCHSLMIDYAAISVSLLPSNSYWRYYSHRVREIHAHFCRVLQWWYTRDYLLFLDLLSPSLTPLLQSPSSKGRRRGRNLVELLYIASQQMPKSKHNQSHNVCPLWTCVYANMVGGPSASKKLFRTPKLLSCRSARSAISVEGIWSPCTNFRRIQRWR